MKTTILQNLDQSVEKTEYDILVAHIQLLKKDFSLIKKKFHLYDVQELTTVSKVGIVNDDLILINVKAFDNTINDQEKLNILKSLVAKTLPGCVAFITKDLIKLLKDNDYEETAKNVEQLASPKGEINKKIQKDAEYLNNIINKKFPEMIHEFNKSKNIQTVLDFLKIEEKNISNLNDISYGLFANQFSDLTMNDKFGMNFTSENLKEICLLFSKNEVFTQQSKKILVSEISGYNDISFKNNSYTRSLNTKPKI